jgi:uncharacterized protein (DUF433 family)
MSKLPWKPWHQVIHLCDPEPSLVWTAMRTENNQIVINTSERQPREGVAMNREDVLERISIDPNICFGKPCIKGHRIWVSLILDFLASGWSIPEILENYPGLEEADIRACLAYGAEMSRERYVEIWG